MRRKWNMVLVLLALFLLGGCSLRVLDDLYQVPKRSDEFRNLQSAVDKALDGLEYCAPLNGENLQTVQMADLDGDGVEEYLLFARGTEERPLHILIFAIKNGEYVLSDTIESHGTAFDLVEYARIDDQPGVELIVGCQISQDVARSVSVYSLRSGKIMPLMSANYTRFLSCDLAGDEHSELMVLRSGESEEDNGLAELYRFADGAMSRVDQINLSGSVERLKRIELGRLHDGGAAVYVDTAVGAGSVVTDVFSVIDGSFTNLNQSGNQTLRGGYIYAEDIDNDEVVELPALIDMYPLEGYQNPVMQQLIRWYALTSTGETVDKLYTCHNLQDGWYLVLDAELAHRLSVKRLGNSYEFFVWDEAFSSSRKLITIYALSGSDRKQQAAEDGRFAIYEDDTTVYAGKLEVCAAEFGIGKQQIIERFHLIHQDWKTQEVPK